MIMFQNLKNDFRRCKVIYSANVCCKPLFLQVVLGWWKHNCNFALLAFAFDIGTS